MKSGMVVARHPLHPALVYYPIGSVLVSLLADCVYMVTRVPFWWGMTFWSLIIGVVGMFVATGPGLWDYATAGRVAAPRIGIAHMAVNGLALAALVADIVLMVVYRSGGGWMFNLTFALTIAGNVLLGYSAWLGRQMVYHYRVGVTEAGEPQAPAFRVTLAPERAERVESAPPTSYEGP